MHKKVPFRLVSTTASKSAWLIRMVRPSRVIPALFTKMSTRPKVSRVWATRVWIAASSATLA